MLPVFQCCVVVCILLCMTAVSCFRPSSYIYSSRATSSSRTISTIISRNMIQIDTTALIETIFHNMDQNFFDKAIQTMKISVEDTKITLESLRLQFTEETFRSILKTIMEEFVNNATLQYLFVAIISSSLTVLIGKSRDINPKSTLKQQVSPYRTSEYDPIEAADYFNKRPFSLLKRSYEIASPVVLIGIQLYIDYLRGCLFEPAIEEKRAKDITQLLTKLGPTFVKVGQSLSIRTDLLRPAYLKELAKLQDQVPAFSSIDAVEIIENELGVNVKSIFSSGVSKEDKVVAAASLGQVYRARLARDNKEVAVKVQRPFILERVAIDMHILRSFAPILKSIAGLQSDLVGLVDDWGTGFVNELNYRKEAENSEIFMRSISTTPLAGVVFAPPVINEFCTDKVLVTEWVQGERLEKSSSKDVAQLCAIAMNTYLTMMLDTGVLHCDPHPGNLLRTPDGKLCILDWGLVTNLDPDLQISFIEHIAHLTSRDYEKVPSDLVKLGFVPAGKETLIQESGVVSVLAEVYSEFARGGGANKIDVSGVISKMQGLAGSYGNLFQVPPYFAYIARAFGVLEGIGLASDPDYAIVGECLPYISQRLLSDTDPRTGSALKTFVFGKNKDQPDRVIDTERLELLLQGFNSYSQTSEGSQATSKVLTSEQIERFADRILDLVLRNDNGQKTPLQILIIDEASKILGAVGRNEWASMRKRSGVLPSGRTILGSIVDPLGIFQFSPLVRNDDYDRKILESSLQLITLLRRLFAEGDPGSSSAVDSPLNSAQVREILGQVLSKLWLRRKDLSAFSAGIAAELVVQAIRRIEATPVTATTATATRILMPSNTLPRALPATETWQSNNVPVFGVDSIDELDPNHRAEDSPRLLRARDLIRGLYEGSMNT